MNKLKTVTIDDLLEDLFCRSAFYYDFDEEYSGLIYFVADKKVYFIYNVETNKMYYRVSALHSLLKKKKILQTSEFVIEKSVLKKIKMLYGLKPIRVFQSYLSERKIEY